MYNLKSCIINNEYLNKSKEEKLTKTKNNLLKIFIF